MKLREYQTDLIEGLRNSLRTGHKRPIMVLQTGGGKTPILNEIMKTMADNGKQILFLVHRRNLIFQVQEMLKTEFGVEAGIIMAGVETDPERSIQLCSVMTYSRRLDLEDLAWNRFFVKADIVLIDECLSPDTEILTTGGWIYIKDLKGEKVAQYNQSTKGVSFVVPEKKIQKEYTGKLVHFYRQNSLDLLGTPNHEQPFFTKGGNIKRKSFKEWKASGSHSYPVAGFAITERRLTNEDRFKIITAADGHIVTRQAKKHHMVQFHFSKERKIARFKEIVEKCGYEYTEVKSSPIDGKIKKRRRFQVRAPIGITKNLYEICNLEDVSSEFAKEFIEELIQWDGSTKKGIKYWSGTKERDADYIQAVCSLGGIKVSHNIQIDNRKETYKDVHRMVFVYEDLMGCQNTKKTMVDYSGMVYCVRVPTGNIVIRRNRRVMITGNCHRAISKTYKDILKLYSDKIIIGCTATPVKANQRGMGEVFDDIVIGPTVKELTDQGYLSPVRYFVPNKIDLEDVPIAMGDYQVTALANKVTKQKLIGDIVENWLKNGENRKTLVYAVNVKHSIALYEAFTKAGVKTARLDAKNTDEERDAVFKAMEGGEVTVLINVLLYVEGLNCPAISCLVFARPTKSLGLYRQAGGRGLRVEEGKRDLIFFDHANVVEEFGLLDWDIEWTLDGKERAYSKPKRETVKKLVKCRACGLVFEGSSICPDCGSAIRSFGQDIETAEGELEELNKKNGVISDTEKRLFLGMLKHYIPLQKNPNPKRIYGIFKSKYGEWPSRAYSDVAPIEPDSTFKSYMKYVNIKWAKRRNK